MQHHCRKELTKGNETMGSMNWYELPVKIRKGFKLRKENR